MKINNVPAGWESLINRLENKKWTDETTPALSYESYVLTAAELFVQKDTDYDSRYLRALIALHARTIWAWEVDKKLDRIRTWIKRGELQVKGEGIRNSVDDLFIYTVQYAAYTQAIVNNQREPEAFLKEVRKDREVFFYNNAVKLRADEWAECLVGWGRIKPEELLLQNLIRSYMGDQVRAEEWQLAIKRILNK